MGVAYLLWRNTEEEEEEEDIGLDIQLSSLEVCGPPCLSTSVPDVVLGNSTCFD